MPSGVRVLLAENNRVSRKVAQLMLERLGHQVDPVCTGVEATRAVQDVAYDLVMMDDRMPEMDGSLAVQVIRAGQPLGGQPVVVAVSADAFGPGPAGTGLSGVDFVLAKPLRLQQLSDLLDRVAHPPAPGLPSPEPDTVDGTAEIRARLAAMAGPDPSEDREVFSDLLRSLARRAPADADLVHDAVRRSDHQEVESRAHSLKGAVVTLAGVERGRRLAEVEAHGRRRTDVPDALMAQVHEQTAGLSVDLLTVASELDARGSMTTPSPTRDG